VDWLKYNCTKCNLHFLKRAKLLVFKLFLIHQCKHCITPRPRVINILWSFAGCCFLLWRCAKLEMFNTVSQSPSPTPHAVHHVSVRSIIQAASPIKRGWNLEMENSWLIYWLPVYTTGVNYQRHPTIRQRSDTKLVFVICMTCRFFMCSAPCAPWEQLLSVLRSMCSWGASLYMLAPILHDSCSKKQLQLLHVLWPCAPRTTAPCVPLFHMSADLCSEKVAAPCVQYVLLESTHAAAPYVFHEMMRATVCAPGEH